MGFNLEAKTQLDFFNAVSTWLKEKKKKKLVEHPKTA